jgi:hypothetical protein
LTQNIAAAELKEEKQEKIFKLIKNGTHCHVMSDSNVHHDDLSSDFDTLCQIGVNQHC